MNISGALTRRTALTMTVALTAVCPLSSQAASEPAANPAKARIVVMTDIGGDPDDEQSLVRFLLYACDFDVEGLCTGFGHGHSKGTRPDLLRKGVEAYGKVVGNLRKHRQGYPSADRLMGLIKDGHNGDPHKVGPGMDSEASEWIIKVLDRDDPRCVWFSIWGGPRELAQAIWKVQTTRTSAQLAAFKRKIRVHSIADQDRTAGWVKKNHPDVVWLFSSSLFRGIWRAGDQRIVSPAWLEKNVRTGHGPLGVFYPAKAAGKAGVKEGDTPSFFYVLPDGLSDPAHPEWGNWGGRFRRRGDGNEYIPSADLNRGRADLMYTIHRWRGAYQNAFAARMDWCVKGVDQANHAPTAVCNGDRTLKVLQVSADPGVVVKLSADGSSDRDGDRLACRWWVYREAGTYRPGATIDGADRPSAALTMPPKASGRTLHVILEVTDAGKPALTAYRRVVITVSGKRVALPSDAGPPGVPMGKPVLKLTGPDPKTGPWAFYRGVNLNGPEIEIDGNRWDGDNAANFTCDDKPIDNPSVRLNPPTNAERAKMIHAFRWDRTPRITMTAMPKGDYAVYAYVWEETSPERFTITLNGRVVEKNFDSGVKGQWRRLGPWAASVSEGKITITTRGGAANFSGIEVWRKSQAVKRQ